MIYERINSNKLSDKESICYKRLAQDLEQSLHSMFISPVYGVPYCDNFYSIEMFQDIVLPLDNEGPYSNDQIKSMQEDYQRYLKGHNLTACSLVSNGVFIDDQYISAALKNEQHNRDSFRSDLEYFNKKAAECEHYA